MAVEDLTATREFWRFFEPLRGKLEANVLALEEPHALLQKNALVDDDWTPYLQMLHARGVELARAGVSFKTWFSQITQLRTVVRRELALGSRDGPDQSELTIRGMNRMLFLVVEAIGEGFGSGREVLVVEGALAHENHARQGQKLDAIGRFAGSVAHDFNNALAVIGMYSGFLEETLEANDIRRADAHEINSAVARSRLLTAKLLNLSTHGVVALRSFDLDAQVAALEPTLGRLLGERFGMKLIRKKVPDVLADDLQIEQVVVNIVINARESMTDGGLLTIELDVEEIDAETALARGFTAGRFVVMAISDTGSGIDRATQERMFEPYFSTKKVNGAGLGLSIVRGIVTYAGGHVTVYSEIGHGTTVRVYLPVAMGTVETPIELPTVAALQPATVLVVDDQPELRAAVIRVLQAAGCVAIEADSAERAREICAAYAHPIDVVVLDVIMGGVRGDDVAAQLIELRPAMKVVLMSGYTAGALAARARTPLEVLAKPFTPSGLRDAIARTQTARLATPRKIASTGDRKSRVLIVDDDAMTRRVAARTLGGEDFEIVEVATGEAALAAVAARPFDVIVTDVTMPTMSGLELLRAVRRTDLEIPVIMMTGDPSVESAAEAIEHGAFRYLTKPIDSVNLLSVVRHASRARDLAQLRLEAFLVAGARARVTDHETLEVRFQRALNGLFMVCQPIFDARTRLPFGMEALMRTTDSSLAGPLEILEAATTLGQLSALGRRVRALSARVLGARTDDLALFVNLHPNDLLDPDLVDKDAPLSRVARRVILEVTERASLMITPELVARLAELRQLGFRLAVDDIGSGYSGLASFTQLDPEIVKLDMAIVRDVHANKLKQRTIRALCQLCHEGTCLVVAEGVETAHERDCLVELGCDLMQGYFFGRPTLELPF